MRRYGNRIYYGDATRLEMLRAANSQDARAIVVAVDDVEASLRIVRLVKVHFPHLTVFARARNRRHAHLLMDLDADHVVRETFHSSLVLTRHLLVGLGFSDWDSARTVEAFRANDERILAEQVLAGDDEQRMIHLTRRAEEELEALFKEDPGLGPEQGEPPARNLSE